MGWTSSCRTELAAHFVKFVTLHIFLHNFIKTCSISRSYTSFGIYIEFAISWCGQLFNLRLVLTYLWYKTDLLLATINGNILEKIFVNKNFKIAQTWLCFHQFKQSQVPLERKLSEDSKNGVGFSFPLRLGWDIEVGS